MRFAWNPSSWSKDPEASPEGTSGGVDDLDGVIAFYKQHGLDDAVDLESSDGEWPSSSDEEDKVR